MTQFGIDKNGAQCRDIRPHLKAIDPLFDVAFSYDIDRYLIYFNGDLMQSVAVDDMGQDVIEKLRYTYWLNVNGDPIAEMETNNKKIEMQEAAERHDFVTEMAKDLRKAVLKEF